MRRARRRSSTRGFALAEALVSLAIAAMTLALLTGSSWGLRQAAELRAASSQTRSVDWLSARRALQGWASGLTAPSRTETASRFIGTATTARMVVEPFSSGQDLPFVAELNVRQDEDVYYLIARRHMGQKDARVAAPYPQETTVLRTTEPMRLIYLMPEQISAKKVWRYEVGDSDGLPVAIGLEVGVTRVLTARVYPMRSAGCLSARGRGGLKDIACELR